MNNFHSINFVNFSRARSTSIRYFISWLYWFSFLVDWRAQVPLYNIPKTFGSLPLSRACIRCFEMYIMIFTRLYQLTSLASLAVSYLTKHKIRPCRMKISFKLYCMAAKTDGTIRSEACGWNVLDEEYIGIGTSLKNSLIDYRQLLCFEMKVEFKFVCVPMQLCKSTGFVECVFP